MKPSDYLISCDWGTTSFRLYLIRAADGKILHQVDNGMGVKALYAAWNKSGKSSRLDFFLEYLDFRIYLLAKKAQQELDQLSVFISGMASASIGMLELPYATLPFSLSGQDLIYEKIENPKRPAATYLISGLRSQHDVMRGEESQLIGLSAYFQDKSGIAILPGTHSKHIYLDGQAILDFHTYMTGEFFALLSQHSILSNSLNHKKNIPITEWSFFQRGVEAAQRINLLSASFHIRTNELLHQINPSDNTHYLSGMLIGTELKALPPGASIYLCGGGGLQIPYQKALELLGHQPLTVIEAATVEGAVAKAHALFFRALGGEAV